MPKNLLKFIRDLFTPMKPLKSLINWVFLAGPILKWLYRRKERELQELDEIHQIEQFEKTIRAQTSLVDWMVFGGEMLSSGRNATHKLVYTSSYWTFEKLKAMKLGGWRNSDGSPCKFQPLQYALAALSAISVILAIAAYLVSTYRFFAAAGIEPLTIAGLIMSALILAVLVIPMTLVNVLPAFYLTQLNRDHRQNKQK